MQNQREKWASKYGFVLACVGAAMGLGNIWMFPYRLGQYGGAAYLLVFLVFIFTLSVIGLMGEFAFGRAKQSGAIGAFSSVMAEKFNNSPQAKTFGKILGIIPVVGVTGVFTFYLIVVGWIIKYLVLALTNSFGSINIPEYFGGFVGTPQTIIWNAIALILTMIIIRLGVAKGIEKANKIMMPALFGLLILLAVKTLTLNGASEGLKFMFVPDWSYLAKPVTYVMALGQAFFTVCLGGAAMIVYGSYLDYDTDIISSARKTAFFDVIASLVAALIVIPAAFAYNLDAAGGPPLLFITVPNVFSIMPGGYIFGILFFITVLFAALSSAVNLMEVPVEALMHLFKLNRNTSSLIIALVGFVVAIPLNLNMMWFGMFADFFTVYLVPLGAVIAAIMFFWIFGANKAREEINKGAVKPVGEWFETVAKYGFTIIAIIVLILGIRLGGIG
ncbi:sodium-dependent transporter [Anaerobranca gottschalkii]|uniref:Neurotransmitter:Na+ symporter, NSS family n=1 Tax=Anaerobranca gottschalkii DSM 13577 TaxID=1120990 RepID=A0A1I0ABA6_9FIRM|nr:sodium-dependent transporter [Anaerobranca gottschalkii]SES91499.1 neurotransmitter:Na+ symporter, NSS family [Anaerobranca gottschalkii DSM 13577]